VSSSRSFTGGKPAFAEYAADVRSGCFPGADHTYAIAQAQDAEIRAEGRLSPPTPCAEPRFSPSFMEV
jgi:hypothetical protein